MSRPYNAGDEALEVVLVVPPADGGADEPAAGQIADDHAGLCETRDDVRRRVDRDPPRDERRALSGSITSCPASPRRARKRSASSAARSYAQEGVVRTAVGSPTVLAAGDEVRVESGCARPSARTLRRARMPAGRGSSGERRGARRARRRRVRPSPRGRRATSAPTPCSSRGRPRRPASRRPTVRRRRASASRSPRAARATGSTAPVVHRTCESASRRVRGVTASTIALGDRGSTTTTFAPRRVQRPEEAEVLVRRRDHLVARRGDRAPRGRCCSRPSSTPSARRARRTHRRARRCPTAAARAHRAAS